MFDGVGWGGVYCFFGFVVYVFVVGGIVVVVLVFGLLCV